MPTIIRFADCRRDEMFTHKISIVAITLWLLAVACAPAPTPVPTAVPPTAAPAPTSVPTAVPTTAASPGLIIYQKQKEQLQRITGVSDFNRLNDLLSSAPDNKKCLSVVYGWLMSGKISTSSNASKLCGNNLSEIASIASQYVPPAVVAPTSVPAIAFVQTIPSGAYSTGFCNCQRTVRAGEAVYLESGWSATTRELVQEYIDASSTKIWIDNSVNPDFSSSGGTGWGEIEIVSWSSSSESGYLSFQKWQLSSLSIGKHRLKKEVALSMALTDGFDDNKDGKPDSYGPGIISNRWVDIVVAPPGTENVAPLLISPKEGQDISYAGDWIFNIQPSPYYADSYLWGFFQNGVLVWENLRDEKKLSGTQYTISSTSLAHSKFAPGKLTVVVRAQIGRIWTPANQITVTLR
jgi:hypothetical protein